MAGGPMDLWNHWATQILVLLSLSLQVVLLLFAGICRRKASSVLRPLLWLAYQLADSTAIYAIGHLSLSGEPREHQLVAFWAPFLLLHLGGPDNITAYALEDNKLWLRHLVTLVVQVLGAGYVIYKHVAGSGNLIRLAAVLMFVVGVVKYGERTWALKCSNMGSIQSSVKEEPRAKCHFYLEDRPPKGGFKAKVDEEEFLMRHAHSLFHICKCGIVDYSVDREYDNPEIEVLKNLTDEQQYAIMEMELSLMYDMLYTKAAVIHTCFGYCIRIVSPVVTATSFLLFQFSGKDGHSRVDVTITYVLLAGAVLLETRSLLSALGSSWTLPFLCGTRWKWLRHAVLCAGRWERLRRKVVSLHRLVEIMGLSGYLRSARRWSGAMGQYNMLHLCTRPSQRKRSSRSISPGDSPLLGRLARMLGLEEWWDIWHHKETVKVSEDLKERLFTYVKGLHEGGEVSSQGIVRKKWGQVALENCNLYKDEDLEGWLGVEFQEGVIILHIATEVFLAADELKEADAHIVKAIRMLSNYMMFLLVERPYMLPGLAQTRLYQRTCKNLVEIWCEDAESPASSSNNNTLLKNLFRFRLHDDPNSPSSLRDTERLADILLKKDIKKPTLGMPRVNYATHVAKELINYDKEREQEKRGSLLLSVWTDFLVYAANRCSRESHAKKLSSGGELTTVVWLLVEHLHLLSVADELAESPSYVY